MIGRFFFLLLSASVLFARTNPFVPASDTHELNVTSNQAGPYKSFNGASLVLPSSARVIREVTVKFINLDGSVGRKSIYLDNSVDWHLPIFISQSYNSTNTQTVEKQKHFNQVLKFHSFLTLQFLKKSVEILTKDKNIRHMLMVDPYRVVLDFRRKSDFASLVKKIPKSIFKKVLIGNHTSYYRIVIELDGQYAYSIKKIQGGYLLVCH
jgi:hypothetical protein